MESGDLSCLQRMETRLRREAMAFVSEQMRGTINAPDPLKIIEQITGKRPANATECAEVREIIRKKLIAERRCAKGWRPGYDMNRHISLSKALNYLDSFDPDIPGSKKANGRRSAGHRED